MNYGIATQRLALRWVNGAQAVRARQEKSVERDAAVFDSYIPPPLLVVRRPHQSRTRRFHGVVVLAHPGGGGRLNRQNRPPF